MEKKKIAVIMGSKSDLPIMQEAFKILDEFSIPREAHVISAHRSPDLAADFAKNAAGNNIAVIIAGAGCAAHLAGAIAANTVLPVIGVPLDGSSLNGLDSLLATVQMPREIPVATVAIGKAGAINAALLAIEILAVSDQELSAALLNRRQKLADDVRKIVI